MPQTRSRDGRWLFVDAWDGDGNVVVYRLNPDGSILAPAVWDAWSQDAVDGSASPAVPAPPGAPPAPDPGGPAAPAVPSSPGGTGGLVEPISDAVVRPRLSAAQMAGFVPPVGAFRFPAPYGTLGVRLTNARDGNVRPIGMSYWPNINNHAGRQELNVLLSLDDQLTLFAVDKTTGAPRSLGPLPFRATGEGCYWSLTEPDAFYVPQSTGLLRYDVTRASLVEVVAAAVGEMKQFHSSADGQVHSFTLDDAAAVWYHGELRRFPSPAGGYDECQVSKSGRWLLIKEGDGGADNRVVDLQTGRDWTVRNKAGAVGHSDMGYGYVVGEDDYASDPGAFRLWTFTEGGPLMGPIVYRMHGWDSMTRYVSHCCARPSGPFGQRALFSSAFDGDFARANEIVAVSMGSPDCIVACPNLSDLAASGGGIPYWRHPRANLDPLGEWACWTANCGTDRLDAFLVRLPW